MSLFGKARTIVALIDVRTSSIGAGYAVLEKGKAPTLAYAVRLPLAPRATEPLRDAAVRTLDLALDALVKEGGPVLRKAAGTARTDRAYISLASPWQRSHVYDRKIETGKPFTFTKATFEETAKQAPAIPSGWTRVSEMVIATLVNGYEIADPIGKRANRAELIMLSSAADTSMMESVGGAVRSALHQHRIDYAAFSPELYDAYRDVCPHQRDFLMLDIGDEAMDIVLAKHGLLVSATCIDQGVRSIARAAHGSQSATAQAQAPMLDPSRNADFAARSGQAESAWLSSVNAALSALAQEEPLPRTVFLFAEERTRDYLKNLLDSPVLRPLWLSDESLAILPVLPSQFGPFLGQGSVNPPDAALAVLALSAEKRLAD